MLLFFSPPAMHKYHQPLWAGEPVDADGGPAYLISQSMRAYADRTSESGFWLDWLDAALFASNNEKTLAFVSHCRANDAPLEIQHASHFLKEIPGLSDDEADHGVHRNMDTWLLLSCNVSFDRKLAANHWIPCVFKEVLAEKTYSELVDQQIAKLKVLIATRQSDLLDVELEEDEEVAAHISASLNDEICM